MMYLLDTNSCVDYLRRGASSKVYTRIASLPPDSVALCSVVTGELFYGAEKSNRSAMRLADVEGFQSMFKVFDFDLASSRHYGALRAHLERIGMPIGPNDLKIASVALLRGLTVVTSNLSEFIRVPGLTVEDWK